MPPFRAIIFDFFGVIGGATSGPAEPPLNLEVVELIGQLKASYRIALLSNADRWLHDVLRQNNLEQLFNCVVLSSEVGMQKPQPEIFEFTVGRLQVKPNEAVFVDDIEDFVGAAEKLGIRGVVFEDAAQLRQELKRLGVLDVA
jgi:putative hydrolase of the HAD superfamily